MEYGKRGRKNRPPRMVREAAAAYLPGAAGGDGGGGGEERVSAAEFKTHCLRLIERVQRERGTVVVTRYGRPVARLVPYDEAPGSLLGHVAGAVSHYGDLVSPVGEAWEADA